MCIGDRVCAAEETVCQQAFQAVGRGGVILLFALKSSDIEDLLNINDEFWLLLIYI